MKQLATILCLGALTTGTFGQGLINFLNNNTTLTSAAPNGPQLVLTSGPVGSWYYGLLIGSGPDPNKFLFSGVYATNIATAGRLFGGTSVQVPGWAAGTTTNYAIAIWSSSLGHNFNPGWLQYTFNNTPSFADYFGISSVATGTSGGDGTPPTPAYNLFGGATGIESGFVAHTVLIPEPSGTALAGLGATALLIFRRRWRGRKFGKPPKCSPAGKGHTLPQ